MTVPVEPSLALQIAVTAALGAGGGIGAPVADQFKEDVPPPYVRTGDDIVTATPADCFERSVSVRTALHAFTSRTAGRRAVKQLAAAIVDRLNDAALDLSAQGWTLNTLQHAGTQMLDEPDGVSHAVVTFNALLDPA